jgi:drug/metabolite transporter (DMT)-like permease
VAVAPAAKPPAAWALALAFAIIYTAWGTTYYAIKLGVRDERLPPLLFGGARIAIGGALLLAYQWLRGDSLRMPRRNVLRLLGIGWLMFVAGNGLIGYGQKTVDSSIAAVLIATTPLWIGLLAMLWPGGERLTRRGWLGLVLGLAGVFVLLTPQWLNTELAFDAARFLLVLGSAASWALGSLLLRHVPIEQSRLTAATYQMLLGGVSMLGVGTLLGEVADLPERVTASAVAVFCYLLIVGSLGGFVAFNWLLGHVSAAKVGTYAYVNPLVAVLIGCATGEDFTWALAAGMTIILLGVFLVRGGEKRPEPRRDG